MPRMPSGMRSGVSTKQTAVSVPGSRFSRPKGDGWLDVTRATQRLQKRYEYTLPEGSP